jgi:hypothetical protein
VLQAEGAQDDRLAVPVVSEREPDVPQAAQPVAQVAPLVSGALLVARSDVRRADPLVDSAAVRSVASLGDLQDAPLVSGALLVARSDVRRADPLVDSAAVRSVASPGDLQGVPLVSGA